MQTIQIAIVETDNNFNPFSIQSGESKTVLATAPTLEMAKFRRSELIAANHICQNKTRNFVAV